jgi:SAM-dependent methyltransferase
VSNINALIAKLLKEPLLRDTKPGTLEYFVRQQQIIKSKPLLHRSFREFYDLFVKELAATPARDGSVLFELGSGAGFLKDIVPSVITSDVVPGVADTVVDARSLPFANGSVRGIFMASVFHHIPDARMFFRELDRVLVPGGVVSMIEPAWTPLGRFFYTHLHHEPCNPKAVSWEFLQHDAMLDANTPLAWIVFSRDRRQFEAEFPALRITQISYLSWLSYMASGGVNYRQMPPRLLDPLFILCDSLLAPLRPLLSLTWYIGLRKQEV